MTLTRLTYSYDPDTENKQRIFSRILSENLVSEQDGRLHIVPNTQQYGPRRAALLYHERSVLVVDPLQELAKKWHGHEARILPRC
jgi:hypothetical protein